MVHGHEGGTATPDGIARGPFTVVGTAIDLRDAKLPGADPASALEGGGRARGTGD